MTVRREIQLFNTKLLLIFQINYLTPEVLNTYSPNEVMKDLQQNTHKSRYSWHSCFDAEFSIESSQFGCFQLDSGYLLNPNENPTFICVSFAVTIINTTNSFLLGIQNDTELDYHHQRYFETLWVQFGT